jgi:hypothetical protein
MEEELLKINILSIAGAGLPNNAWAVMGEVLLGTVIAALVFFVFSLLLMVGIHFVKQYL